jgi:hypothetical protein
MLSAALPVKPMPSERVRAGDAENRNHVAGPRPLWFAAQVTVSPRAQACGEARRTRDNPDWGLLRPVEIERQSSPKQHRCTLVSHCCGALLVSCAWLKALSHLSHDADDALLHRLDSLSRMCCEPSCRSMK